MSRSQPHHVLVLDLLDRQLEEAPSKDSKVIARFVRNISEAVRELQQAGYDAVVLRMESAREMSLLLRIKGVAPDVPLLALIPQLDSELDAMARESGADQVLPAEGSPDQTIHSMGQFLESSDELIRRSREVIARSKAIRTRKSELSARARAIQARTFDLAEVPLRHLSMMLVEDNPDHAVLFKRTCVKMGLSAPITVLKNGEETIAYLAGRRAYRDRTVHPLPTLVILDLHLPRKSGLEVLQWIRSRPALSKLIVFILSSSPLREDFDRSIELGADSYFVKPLTLDGLRDLLGVMVTRWGHIYSGLHL